MAKSYCWDNRSLAALGIDPIKHWSERDCVYFWDTMIKENLRQMRDCPTQLEDVLNWVFSDYFALACLYAGLDVETMRDGVLHVVDEEKLKPKKKRLSAKTMDAIWESVQIGESLSLFELVEEPKTASTKPKQRRARRVECQDLQLAFF